MPLVHLYTRMIPRDGDDPDEYPFKLRHVDSLEYISGSEKHRQEIVATILPENGVEPGRLYEGQLWKITDEDDHGKESVLGWFAGGEWSANRIRSFGKDGLTFASLRAFSQEQLPDLVDSVIAVESARSVVHLITRDIPVSLVLEFIDMKLSGDDVKQEDATDIARRISAAVGLMQDTLPIEDIPAFNRVTTAHHVFQHAINSEANSFDVTRKKTRKTASCIAANTAGLALNDKREIESVIRRCLLMQPLDSR